TAENIALGEGLPRNVNELARTAAPVSFKTALNKTSKRTKALAGVWLTDGCNGHQSCHLPDRDICRCVGDGCGGLCFRIGRRCRLAAAPHARRCGVTCHCLPSRRAGGVWFG